MAYCWSFGVNYVGSCSSPCCNCDSKTPSCRKPCIASRPLLMTNPATLASPTSFNFQHVCSISVSIYLCTMYVQVQPVPTIPSRSNGYLAISFHLRRLGVMLAARVPRLLAALKSATREEYWVSCSESKRSFKKWYPYAACQHAFINYHSSHSHIVILLLNLV